MKSLLAALLMIAFSNAVVAQIEVQQNKTSSRPVRQYVPDAKTAVAIAIAVLAPIYGAEKIRSEAPFVATLRDGVWTVVGTLPPGFEGGVAEIDISKAQGTILRVSHGK